MTINETKKEILRIIDQLPEKRLIELLSLLNDLQQYPALDIASAYQVKQIIDEDSEVFRRLAE